MFAISSDSLNHNESRGSSLFNFIQWKYITDTVIGHVGRQEVMTLSHLDI